MNAVEGKIAWQADESLAPPVAIYAELLQDGELLAETKIELAAPVETRIEPKGGTASGMEGDVQVTFPEGALTETVTVTLAEPSFESLPVESLSGAPFEIIATSEATEAEVSRFSEPVEIRVSYSGRLAGGSESDLVLYWYDPTDGQWKLPLRQYVDVENDVLVAYTDHFTTFDTYNSNWQSAVTPTLTAFQTSNFTGASSFSLPINVPAGPGGFQPSLTLSYSSSVVDNSSSESQASWVGMGWSLTTSYIERNGHGTNSIADDSFQLNLNGMSVELLPGSDGKYHASSENFYKVELNDPTNEEGSTWTIWDISGNQYFFEWRTHTVIPNECGGGFNMNKHVWRWSLTRVVNIYDQLANPARAITYSYAPDTRTVHFTDCFGDPESMTSTIWIYPESITYANNRYRIEFDRTDRYDYKTSWTSINSLYKSFQRYLLDAIRVTQDSDGNGTFETLIRKYKFTYCNGPACNIFPDLVWSAGGRTPTLVSVQEFGLGGTQSLPPYSFTYGDHMHLTQATNGYGGTIDFAYNVWHDTIPAGSIGGNPILYENTSGWSARSGIPGACLKTGALRVFCEAKNSNVAAIMPGSYYTVLATAMADKWGTGYPWGTWVKIGLSYKTPDGVWHDQYSQSFNLPLQQVPGSFPPVYQSVPINIILDPVLVPYNATEVVALVNSNGARMTTYRLIPVVTAYRVETQTVSTGSDSYATSFLYDGASTNTPALSESAAGGHPYIKSYTEFRGHEYVTVTDPYGARTTTRFDQHDCLVGSPLEVTLRDGAGVKMQSSTSTYDCTATTSQLILIDNDTRDPALYNTEFDRLKYYWARTVGNWSAVYQSNGVTEAGSTTTSSVYESTYGNITSQTVSGTGLSTLTTHYEYYNNTSGGKYIVNLPSRVWITKGTDMFSETINIYDGNGILIKTRTLLDVVNGVGQYSQATMGYDTWGNVTSLTTYSGYGTAIGDPATGARTATTVYDSVYHTYPISITTPPTAVFPSGLTTTLTYNYSLGVPTSETGPNGAATMISAEYDSFGRLTKLIRPGDDSTSPTLAIQYPSSSSFTVTLTQKINPGQFSTVTRVYDGLGRPTSITTTGDITTLYDYGYLNGARVDWVSMPYASGEQVYYTETEYDDFARPVRVTAPDGNTSVVVYNGLDTTATDANGNATTTMTDILRRPTFVHPPTGPDVAYTYDDLGNLETAVRGGVTVTMNYDLGGRKRSMSDPDMGSWTYEYDALNNLTSQTDARGCTLALTYDLMSRLDTKTSSGNCGQQMSVNYDYDSGQYGVGFRTSMSDGSGSTSWEYDDHGRLKKESKTITGNSAFVTEWTYNSADMPVTMKYPDGEVVTYNYDTRALPNSMIGTNTYVSSSIYDSAGRAKTRTLGNGLTQTFGYYDWNEKVNNVGQGGRLETLVTGTLQNLSYQYDAVGNIKQIVNSIANEISTYEYDAIYRLTNWTLGQTTESYSYNSTSGNLETKGTLGLQYNDGNHVHAVTNANDNTYGYDANGNQTTRQIAGSNYVLGYDAENQVVSVTGPSLNAQFTYDGDGRRVKSVVNGETILFAGSHFELNDTTGEVSKYYFAGAIRIAVRKYIVPQTTTLSYLLGDHLGSTSLVTNESGNLLVETRYKPWGEVRYTTSNQTLPTRYTFTGQYSHVFDDATDLGAAGFGLMYYNARWYDPALGRMAQVDSVVPEEIQGLDRYAYVGNNPINYVDPTGHIRQRHLKDCQWDHTGWCSGAIGNMEAANGVEYWQKKIQEDFPNVTIINPDSFNPDQLIAIYNALTLVRNAFGGQGQFESAFGDINIKWASREDMPIDPYTGKPAAGTYDTSSNTISLSDDAFYGPHDSTSYGVETLVHELGHQFDFRGSFDDACTRWGCDPTKLKSNSFIRAFMPEGCHKQLADDGCTWEGYDPSDKGTTSRGLLSSTEDFADSFAIYILYGTPAFGASSMRLNLIHAWIILTNQHNGF